ncbi:hypothetical protein D3C78_1310150 [compost metagenome]
MAEHGVHHLLGDRRERCDVDGFSRLELANELALQLAGLLVEAADLEFAAFTAGAATRAWGGGGNRFGGDDLLDARQLAAGEIQPHRDDATPHQGFDLLAVRDQPHLGYFHGAGLAGDGDHIHAGLQLADGDDGMRRARLHTAS